MGKTKNKSTARHCYIDPELAWQYIEMGRDVDDLYPEKWNVTYSLPKSYLLPGEKYHFLTNNLTPYAMTSLGRIFSCFNNQPKQLVPSVYKHSIIITLRDVKINVLGKLKEYGWNKNVVDVYDIYMTYRWKFYYYESGTYTTYNNLNDEEE